MSTARPTADRAANLGITLDVLAQTAVEGIPHDVHACALWLRCAAVADLGVQLSHARSYALIARSSEWRLAA
jgi:hypothetical protein